MNTIRFAALAALAFGLAATAQAQTTQAPDQSTAAPAKPVKPAVVKKAHLLTPDEIKATFGTGKPFAATSPAGKVIMITLKPDGAAASVPKDSKAGRKGTWRVSDTGYCSTWDKSTEHCYQIRQAATGYNVETINGTLVARWAKP